MLVKIFLVSIIVIVSGIILYEMTTDPVIEYNNEKKLQTSNEIDETCKKVRFNLEKNTIKLISPNNKKKKLQNQLKKFITAWRLVQLDLIHPKITNKVITILIDLK